VVSFRGVSDESSTSQSIKATHIQGTNLSGGELAQLVPRFIGNERNLGDRIKVTIVMRGEQKQSSHILLVGPRITMCIVLTRG
jgi:hypothetical protein